MEVAKLTEDISFVRSVMCDITIIDEYIKKYGKEDVLQYFHKNKTYLGIDDYLLSKMNANEAKKD